MAVMTGEGALSVYARAKELEREGRSIIHLELGEPDFHPSVSVNNALKRAIDEGKDRYCAVAGVLLGIAAAYHVVCWSVSGRTLGGLVVGQRVIAVDGARPTVGQAVVRLLTLPLGWFRGPFHDELAGTDVIVDRAK